MKQYVILGGGVASVGCIEGIRSVDRETPIVLICGERKPVYCRPLISYYLQGKTDLERMKYRPDEFYGENNCQLVYADGVGIDPVRQTVRLDSGEEIPYDALCLATGSSPFVPPFEGLDTVAQANKFSFMTQEDAVALEEAVTPDSRVLIVGAGLIGLKCAEGLADRVGSITVCDLAPRVLSSILDEPCAALMQRELEAHGIRFLLGDSAQRFDGSVAHMKSGETVPFDVLVLAVGVRPNTSLFQAAGGKTDRGIVVDTSMRTSLDHIYAAGDCAQGYDASTGENRILAILPNAYFQGNCAGVNMAGGSQVLDNAIPMNAIGFYGLHALTAGSYDGELFEEKAERSIKRLFVRDGRLVGFMMIGETDRAGIYTALVRNQTPLDTLDFEVLKKTPSLVPFSSEYRRQTLGGVV
jgi:NAD(P)H-nitrite reductase large subunit